MNMLCVFPARLFKNFLPVKLYMLCIAGYNAPNYGPNGGGGKFQNHRPHNNKVSSAFQI